MYLSKDIKKKIFKDNSKSDTDTGSAEAQIALFTYCLLYTSDAADE